MHRRSGGGSADGGRGWRGLLAPLVVLATGAGGALLLPAAPAGASVHTTTTLALSANPSAYGSPVTVTATVTDTTHTGVPTGTVSFSDTTDALTLCGGSSALTGSGASTATASCSFTPTVSGGTGRTIALSGAYSGSASDAASTGTASLTVLGGGSTTLTAGAHSATTQVGVGDSLNATVAGGATVPTGRVAFFVNGSPQACTPSLNASGKASCSWTPTSAGTQSVTFSYAGDANYAANGPSAPFVVTVTGTASATTATPTLVSPAAPSAGTPITVSTSVSGGSGTPTGSVTFTATVAGSPSTPCPAVSLSAGAASCTFTPSFGGGGGGTVAVTAAYSGDGTYAASSSGTLSVAVTGTATPTSFVLTSSKNPLVQGQVTSLRAQLAGSPTPTGTVTFTDGGVPITCGTSTAVKLSSGSASCAFTPATVGTHPLVATYSGDANFAAIAAAAPGLANSLSQVVNGAAATVTVTSAANPTPYGSTVTETATVSGTGTTPTGTVAFNATVGSSTTPACATATLVPGSGSTASATCSYTPPASGGNGVNALVTAVYSGDSQYASGTGTLTQIEAGTAVPSSFIVNSTAPDAVPGTAVSLRAFFTGSPMPTGTVTFTDNGSPILCGGTAPNVTVTAGGIASCAYTVVGPFGAHTIVASYSGDATYAAASASGTQLAGYPSTTTVTSTANPALNATTVILTATVTGQPGGGAPGGTVSFYDETDLLLVCANVHLTAASSDSATAHCTYTAPVGDVGGDFQILTTYNTSGTVYVASNTLYNQLVLGDELPRISLQFSANPSPYEAPVTLTAVVGDPGMSVVPSGTVTFSDSTDNLTLCANVALVQNSAFSALATCVFTPTGSGGVGAAFTVTAAYSGDPVSFLFAPATNNKKFTEAGTGATTLTAGVSKSAIPVGSGVSLQATVGGAGTTVPSGRVSVFLNGVLQTCTPTLNAAGYATCIVTPAAPGSYQVTFTYAGDVYYAPAGPSSPVTLTVSGTTPSTVSTPVAVPALPPAGGPVTVSAQASGASGTPTGFMTFTATAAGTSSVACATAPLDGTGTASCTFTPVLAGGGTVQVTAAYSGDDTYAPSTSRSLTVTVTGTATPTSFTLTASKNPVSSGTLVSFSAQLAGTPTPTGSVTFTDNGTPVCTAVHLTTAGKATCSETVSGSGAHAMVATYSGDATYAPQNATLSETVN